MNKGKLLFANCFLIFLLVSSSQVSSQVLEASAYVDLYKEKTSWCKSGVHCCALRAQCLTDIRGKIAKDFKASTNGRIIDTEGRDMHTHFYKVVHSVRDEFYDPACSSAIQLGFDFLYRSHSLDSNVINLLVGKTFDSQAEIYEGIKNYISLYGHDPGFVSSCGSQTEFSDAEIVSPLDRADYLFNLLRSSIEEDDFYSAKVYTNSFIKTVGDKKRKAAGIKILGDIVFNLEGPEKAEVVYREAVEFAYKENFPDAEMDALAARENALVRLQNYESLLDIFQRRAAIYGNRKDRLAQALEWKKSVKIFVKLQRADEVRTYLEKSRSAFEKLESWNHLADTLSMEVAYLIDESEYIEACKKFDEFKVVVLKKEVEASKALNVFNANLNCK